MEVTKVKSWIDVKNKEQKGITLIALVITIIVLLILAGISINLLLGENGIINRATNAVSEHEKAAAKEEAELFLAEVKTGWLGEKNVNGSTERFSEYLENNYGSKIAKRGTGEYSYISSKGIEVEFTVDDAGNVTMGGVTPTEEPREPEEPQEPQEEEEEEEEELIEQDDAED